MSTIFDDIDIFIKNNENKNFCHEASYIFIFSLVDAVFGPSPCGRVA
jgi:hypothetical protein